MRWLAAECVAAAIVAQLRAAHHDVSYIAELAPGETDLTVIAGAQREQRLLLTDDKDFGELVFRRGRAVPGVVSMRVEPERGPLAWARLEAAIARFGHAGLAAPARMAPLPIL